MTWQTWQTEQTWEFVAVIHLENFLATPWVSAQWWKCCGNSPSNLIQQTATFSMQSSFVNSNFNVNDNNDNTAGNGSSQQCPQCQSMTVAWWLHWIGGQIASTNVGSVQQVQHCIEKGKSRQHHWWLCSDSFVHSNGDMMQCDMSSNENDDNGDDNQCMFWQWAVHNVTLVHQLCLFDS